MPLSALLLCAAAVGAATQRISSKPGGQASAPAGPELVLRLGEGADEAAAAQAIPRPVAGPLDDAATARVLDRLPPLPADVREQPFARREDSLPPPRAGRTVATPFPPEAGADRPAAAPDGPLVLLRHAPDGEVPLAPQLSLTFSQPMVELTSHGALARDGVPVRLAPEVPGEWRWVGTRTLLFEPAGRLPMATEYHARVPAGTRSATGGRLAADASWSFGTPAPRLLVKHPQGGPARRDALLFASFDQRVDPAAVLATLHLRAGGTERSGAPRDARPSATRTRTSRASRKKPSPAAGSRSRRSGPLPADAPVEVVIGPGTPSAEGPRRTSAAQAWSFRTYGPFRVRSHECGWGGRCTPLQPWRIATTNPVDARTLRADRVRVEPELPGLKVESWGGEIALRGASKGRTSYRVTLSSEIRDAFGQPLDPGAPLSFTVGPAEALLSGPRLDLVVLDPAGPRALPVYTINQATLRVRAYAVSPSDWPAWQEYRQKAARNEPATPPGRLAIDTSLRVAGAADELVETQLDLSRALGEGLGQLAVVVEPAQRSPRERGEQAVRAWVQSTRIGLDAFADGESLLAWATALDDGRPLGDVEISLAQGAASRSDAGGLARLPLADAAAPLVVARLGHDVAILPTQAPWWSSGVGFRRSADVESLRFCVFDDRRLYRPGEEVRVKGFLRRIGKGPRGDVEPLPAGIGPVAWKLRDAQGNESGFGNARLSGLGAFDFAVKLPATMNLGPAVLQLEAAGSALAGHEHAHVFEVQEFRRPEFEVKAEASEGPFTIGTHATVTVTAAYYAGGALPGAEVSWRVATTPAFFRPPNRDDFAFGTFVPWWEPARGGAAPESVSSYAARSDGSGRHRLRIDFERASPPRPRHVLAEATVMDVNRQAWTASASLLVHPALVYVGLRTARPFVQKGEEVALDAIVTDLDGRAVAGRTVALRAERLDWEQVDGEWTLVPKDVQEKSLASQGEAVPARFEAREGGSWRLVARVSDEAGRVNETELRVWVAGGRVPPRRDLEPERVTLVPDRRTYAAGDVARVLVVAPFAPAEGLLTLRRSGLLREQRFRIEDGSHTLEIPIEDGYTPDVHVQVDLVGKAPRDEAGPAPPRGGASGRPAFASGSLDLAVPPASRTLSLAVVPREAALSPGGKTTVELALRDASGRPVANGEATVVVVDEAVLALTGYRLPDPLAVFYAPRSAGVSDYRLRDQVLLARPEDLDVAPQALAEQALAGGMAPRQVLRSAGALARPAPAAMALSKATAEDKAPEPIRARSDFAALALFAATVPTDGSGHAQVEVTLPDSLTRYRVMAVAAAGMRQFGSGEATLTARLPLMVRPSAPRFLNFGDRFELPVIVQNQTDTEMTVDVAVRARNAVLTAGAGRRVQLAANDRAEVRFPMSAVLAGTARIQVGAASAAAADAALVELPVWTPATTEAFATYGQLDQGAAVQPVRAPDGVVPQFGGLELTTSSTALSALTDAVLYLVAYPFECSEQLSSRVLAIAALRDVLAAFQAEGLPKPDEIESAVKRDLERLRALQNDDGGFAFWRRGDPSWPYVSIHVAHALARAKAKGFAVPEPLLERSRDYLRDVDRRIPRDYPADVRRTLVAYALSVRTLLGDADPARARALVREAGVEALSFEALGFVLPTLAHDPASSAEAGAIRRRLANAVDETAGAAHFAVSYGDGAYLLLHSDRRADAIVLEALIADQPKSDLVPKLVAGLLAHRTAGRWQSTQENVFVLLALDRYFHAYESATPDFVARAWLGERYAGEHAFRGRTTERQHVTIPMAALREGGARSGPAAGQGRPRAALLPDRPALRAREPLARAARPRLHGAALVRGCRRPEATCAGTRTAPGTCGRARACA